MDTKDNDRFKNTRTRHREVARWALKQMGEAPLSSVGEIHQRRVKAREADARGYCYDRKCGLCGGRPPPANALERWERDGAP